MLFNSLAFAIFLPITFALYWGLFGKSLKLQNSLLLLSSYIFYGWWDYRFLGLLVISTIVDFYVGRKLNKEQNPKNRKYLLMVSLAFNLTILGFFKYFNFFIDNWIEAWSTIGVGMNHYSLNVILPVGISFYTFQTLSYTIDIYLKRLTPTSNLLNFSVYVAFFPQLVAGPIERAKNLLPQFSKERKFKLDQAKHGLHLIVWGLFKKIVIADNCAVVVDKIFENYGSVSSVFLIFGIIIFAFQIYADFSGYSDIAIGTAKLLGINLMCNFNYPYFSRNVGEFWRRWHISLSTWFRDYVYIPLGGSRGIKTQQIRNIFIIFIVSGFWHGASWNFLIWGGLHALFFLPLLLTNKNREYLDPIKNLPSVKDIFRILTTFSLVCFAWIFFRAPTLGIAYDYIKNIFTSFTLTPSNSPGIPYLEVLMIIGTFLAIEWFIRNQEHPFTGRSKLLKTTITVLAILFLGSYSEQQEFIYFQF